MHMKRYGPSNIQNMPMFAFNNSILLGYIRAGCLSNNLILRTEDFYISKALSVRTHKLK